MRDLAASDSGFRAEISELRASKLRLIGELSSLIGYASTCQETNRKQWLETLHQYIQRAKEVLDDETHIRLV